MADNNTVQITVSVVDANSGKTTQQVIGNVEKLGTAGAQAGTRMAEGLNAAGAAGEQAGERVGRGMQEMGQHSLTALDNVRLLRDDLGIRVPRSMEKAIASSQVLSTAIGGIGGGLLLVGGIDIGVRLGSQVAELTSKWLDAGKAAEEYRKKQEDIAKQEFAQPKTIEAAGARIDQATDNTRSYSKIAQDAQSEAMRALSHFNVGGFIGGMMASTSASKQQFETQGQIDQLAAARTDQQHKLNLAQIEANHAIDGELQGRAKVSAEMRKQLDIAKENADYRFRQNTAQGNPAGDGDQEAGFDVRRARQQAAAENANINRKEQDEIARAKRETASAGLQGEAKFAQDLRNTIAEINARKREGLSIDAANALVMQAMLRDARDYEARRLANGRELDAKEASARESGMTGLGRLDDEHKQRLNAIDSDQRYTPEERARDRAAENATYFNESKKMADDYADHLRTLNDDRVSSNLSANARILAETRRSNDELKKSFDDNFKDIAASDPRRVAGQAQFDRAVAGNNQDAQSRIQENRERLQDETAKLQAEAGRGGGGNRYAQQVASIQADEDARARQIEREAAKASRDGDLQAEQQYQDQLAAIHQIARNKELDAAREQRDKLAGELRGFMDHPLDALKRFGEEQGSKFAADVLLGHKPGALGGNGVGFGDLVRPTFRRGTTVDGHSGRVLHDEAPHLDSRATTQATISAATAVIHVGNATFAGTASGSSGGAGSPGGGRYVSTGSGSAFNVGSGSGYGGLSLPGMPEYGAGGPQLDTESTSMAGIGVSDADGNPTSIASEIGGAQGALSQANDASQDLGVKGGLLSKVPGLNKLDDDQLSQLSGAAGGALGVFSAFEGKGGVGGAFQGAMSGAKLGAELGGPVGAALGAIAGGVVGFMGHGARVEAQKYWLRELQPKIKTEMQAFEQGSADYQSVYDDVSGAVTEAKQRTRQMGPGAVSYYNERIKPELLSYEQRLTREQKSGRSQYGMTAAQYHDGGPIGGFGSLATSPTEGWVHAEKGEWMLNQQAAMSHGDVAQLMNAGVSRAGIAEYLGAGSGPVMPAQGGDEYHFHFPGPGGKTMYQHFIDHAGDIRAALNQSSVTNSGGADW